MIYFFIPESIFKNYYFETITNLFFFINCFLYIFRINITKREKGKKIFNFDDYLDILIRFFLCYFNKKVAIQLIFFLIIYLIIVLILIFKIFKINKSFLLKLIVENKKKFFGYLLGILIYFFLFINPIFSFYLKKIDDGL